MHSRERKWPVVYGILALELALIAIAAGVLYPAGLAPQQVIARIDWASIAAVENIFVLCIGARFFWVFGRYAIRGRRKERLRARALAGDESAMAIASSHIDLSHVTMADMPIQESLTLHWSNGNTITASSEGFLWERPGKQAVLLAWEEAHLLEMWEDRIAGPFTKKDLLQYGYCLYGSMRNFIEWTDAPDRLVGQHDLSWEQKEQLQEALLAVVIERTGLPMRIVAGGRAAGDAVGIAP